MIAPDPSSAKFNTVTVASQVLTNTMAAREVWLFCSSTNCYIGQGATPVASAADGSTFVPANVVVEIDGTCGAHLAVVRQTADGVCTISRRRG